MATLVQPDVLGKLVLASLIAGLGITAVFGLAIYSATRFVDSRRDGHVVVAWAFAALAVLSLAAFAGAVALGIVVMANKS